VVGMWSFPWVVGQREETGMRPAAYGLPPRARAVEAEPVNRLITRGQQILLGGGRFARPRPRFCGWPGPIGRATVRVAVRVVPAVGDGPSATMAAFPAPPDACVMPPGQVGLANFFFDRRQ